MQHISDAEWKVMDAVWERSPASARDVLDRLGPDTSWAYTTVKTMLTRLVDKGALEASKKGNTSYYTPLISREQARRSALRSLVDKAFDGAFGPLIHFLMEDERLSRKDREHLAELMRETESEGEGRDNDQRGA